MTLLFTLLRFLEFLHCVVVKCSSVSEECAGSVFRVTVDLDKEVVWRKECDSYICRL
jgi:hypothetical protein